MSLPEPMLQALQVNIPGGRWPEPDPGGSRYLKIPPTAFVTLSSPM